MYQIVTYIPTEYLESVKNALFKSGAGQIGNYDRCSWQVKGTGQFRPLKGSSPHLGEQNKTETVEEYRVELICKEDRVSSVIKALKENHPYETPAYSVWKLLS